MFLYIGMLHYANCLLALVPYLTTDIGMGLSFSSDKWAYFPTCWTKGEKNTKLWCRCFHTWHKGSLDCEYENDVNHLPSVLLDLNQTEHLGATWARALSTTIIKWGNIFWRNDVHPSGRVPDTWRIYAKEHRSWSASTWCPNTLQRHFFPLICCSCMEKVSAEGAVYASIYCSLILNYSRWRSSVTCKRSSPCVELHTHSRRKCELVRWCKCHLMISPLLHKLPHTHTGSRALRNYG